MQNNKFRKGLVAGIIFLFIGISVATSVTSIEFLKTKTSNSNDLVEINLQLCKTSGVEDHKMFITQEQDEQLDLLIESFKQDLDNAETREETIEIYNDMVVSLDNLGILPEDLSCKEVQELVTGENSISNPKKMNSNKHFNQAYEKLNNKTSKHGVQENKFCLIAGRTTNTLFKGPFESILYNLKDFLSDSIWWFLWGILLHFWTLNPLTIGYIIGIGEHDSFYWEDFPARGWVFTLGLNGIKFWQDSIYGELPLIPVYFFVPEIYFYPGVTGFTGIKISIYSDLAFYLGFATWVKLSSNRL